MATYQELRTRSQQVRDEQNIGGNTALRVGQLLMDIVKYFYDNDAAASEYLQQHFAMVNDGTQLLNWQQSPIVILHTMGEAYDDGDFSALSQGENFFRNGFIMEADGQGGGINGETPKANVLYVNLANDTLYTWNGASFDAITSGGGGSISGDDIIKNAYYSNGNLVLVIETESGDKTVSIPVTFDASNYVPTSRTVNGKALRNNITLSQSDIPGLVAALAAKVGYSDDEWLQVKAGAMQAATAVQNTTTVNGKQLNDNIVIGMADIPGLETAIGEAGKVKTVSVNNGTPAQPDSNGNVNIQVQTGSTISPATASPSMDGTAAVGSSAKYAREDHVHPHDTSKLSKSDVSVETQGDGTVDINVKDDTYTINLNHTHEGMAKLEIVDEEPSNPALDTIYALVDDAEGPTEIQSLWIAGLEFTGGGGAAPGTPAITKPSGTSINLGENSGSGVSKTIEIKANSHITGDLTVGLAANSNLSFDTTNLPSGVTYNSGAGTLTIAQATAMQGVNITIVYSGSGGAEIDGGLVISGGGASPKSVVVVVVAAPIDLAAVKLTGTQWLQTDYCPGPNTEFSLKCKFTANSNTSNSNYGYQYCYILSCPYDGNKRFSLQNDTNMVNKACLVSYTEDNTTANSIEVSNANFVADNSILRLTKGQSNLALTFLAGGNTQEQGGTATLPLKTTTMAQPLAIGYLFSQQAIYGRYDLTIYEFILSEGGIEKRHYVPKMRNGVPGLYDTKTGTFISSETNDELVAIPLT